MPNVKLFWRESVWPPASCEADTTKGVNKDEKCFCIRGFFLFFGGFFFNAYTGADYWLRLIVMSTNLEYRERERQRKRESRATGQRSSTRKGAKETFSVGGAIWNFVAVGCSRPPGSKWATVKKEWKRTRHSLHKTCSRKFLEVSRNVQKKVCCSCKVAFLLIRPIFTVLVAFAAQH